jgi:lipopolysaccharide export system protein LptA
MEGNVHAVQMTHELSAEKLSLQLDGGNQLRRVVASGHPQMRESGNYGPLDVTADEFAADFRPDGSVGAIVATGNVHGSRNTPQGEDRIDAGRLLVEATIQRNTPHTLIASNGVTLTSTSGVSKGDTRRVATDGLEIHFSPYSRPGDAIVESIQSLAPARAEWQSAAVVNGKPVPQTLRMSGKQIDLEFKGQNQLQRLLGAGGVEVNRKLGDSPEQTTTSRDLTANFDESGDWTTIDQTGDVRLQDGQRTAQGERAHVDHSSNTVTMAGSVVIIDATTRTTAQSASFVQGVRGANVLRAEGRVLTTELRTAGESITNFAEEPAHVSADRLVADAANGRATYSGNGRLWQGPSVIEAGTIELDRASHTFVAREDVRGVFPQAKWSPNEVQASRQVVGQTLASKVPAKSVAGKGRPGPQLGHARGGILTYWQAQSRARIEQNAQVESEQGSIQADKVDLYFSNGSAASGTRELTRAVATGDVAVRQEGRRGTSERAEYTASEGKFVLSEGKPTLYSSTGDSTSGRQLTFYFADDRIVVESAEGSKTVTLHQVEK